MLNINIDRLTAQLLPTFLRRQVRLAWLSSLFTPIKRIWAVYTLWRADKLYEANVTAQTISMEAYLNRLFDHSLKRIRVNHGETKDVFLSLWSEPNGSYFDADEGIFLYLEGELSSDVLDGFIVEIPQSVDKEQVNGVVSRIKAIGVNHTIVVNTI